MRFAQTSKILGGVVALSLVAVMSSGCSTSSAGDVDRVEAAATRAEDAARRAEAAATRTENAAANAEAAASRIERMFNKQLRK